MPKSKSKLGQNPLVPRGVGVFFAEPDSSAPAAADPSVAALHANVTKTALSTKRSTEKSVSHLVNKVTTPSSTDEAVERHTFYLTDAQAQKVKLYALLHRMQISEVVRMLIDNHLKIQP